MRGLHSRIERSPAVEVAAESVKEHDRRAGASRQPFPVKHSSKTWRSLDVAPLQTTKRAGACEAFQRQSPFARKPSRQRRRACLPALGGNDRAGRCRFGWGKIQRRERLAQDRGGPRLVHNRRQRLVHPVNPTNHGADWQGLAECLRKPAGDPISRRFDVHRRLIGLDLEQRLALLYRRAFLDEPLRDLARRHVHVDAGHDDFMRHFRRALSPAVRRRR